MRLHELAEATDLSPSRITRLVGELETRGFVRRQACPTDARGTIAVITDAGRAAVERAYPVQVGRAREFVFDAIPAAEVEHLAGAMSAIADRAACPGVIGPV